MPQQDQPNLPTPVRQALADILALVEAHPNQLDGFAGHVLTTKLAEAHLLLTKQLDYGPGNIGNPPGAITPELALTVRIGDKVNRLGNLLLAEHTPSHEALVDTWLDIANYGTIGSIVAAGLWPRN